ncbi:MAG: LLM class flavin-dependent oxidoreductase [Candidatus Bathyarchaeia archaeon]
MSEVKFGIKIPDHPLEATFRMAKLAEDLGLSSIWMVDHLVDLGVKPWGAYFTWGVLSALASETRKVTLGTAVSDPHRLHPAVLAQAVTTLDHLSGGRAILGLGAGEATNLEPYGISWDHPIARLKEAIQIMKALWTGNPITYKGRFYRLEKAYLRPKPVRSPHPPIWVAAASPNSMKITGVEADGWIPIAFAFPPKQYREKLDMIQSYAQTSGRSEGDIEPALFVHTVVDEDREKAREMIELPAKTLLLYWTPEVFEDYGFNVSEFHLLKKVYDDEAVQELLNTARALPIEPVNKSFIFGTPSDCLKRVREYVEAGVRHFIFAFTVPPEKMELNLRLYVEHVIPEVL